MVYTNDYFCFEEQFNYQPVGETLLYRNNSTTIIMLLRYLLLTILWSCTNSFSQAFILRPSSNFQSSSLVRTGVGAQGDENDVDFFDELGLSPEALKAVRAQPGWIEPTPVQKLVIPQLLKLANSATKGVSAKNPPSSVWCESPTGSGKTAAYALPLLQHLRATRGTTRMNYVEGGQISSLILCPTRELAAQIGSVMKNLDKHMASMSSGERRRGRSLNIMTMYGGTRMEPQISQLAYYVKNDETLDILIATPGRLVDVLTHYNKDGSRSTASEASMEQRLLQALDEQGRSDTSLSLEQLDALQLHSSNDYDDGREGLVSLLKNLKYLVIDEADRLLGQGFQSEMDSVLDLLPKQVATWLFSATFPKQIEPRVDYVLKRTKTANPIKIACTHSDRLTETDETVSSSLKKKLERTATSNIKQKQTIGPASTIDLRAIRIEKPLRTQALKYLLLEEHPEWDRVLVFVATRYGSGHVSRKLRRAGIKSAELHGKLDQDARARRLNELKQGKIRVLLATDVASRGLDIVGLPAVVNYDLPRSTADFVHRVGRTGRAGRPGTAVSFMTPTTETHFDLIERRHLANKIEREVLPGFEPDEEKWTIESTATGISVPGVVHSTSGLAHDRMFGGVKGRRKSKKDKLREQAARDKQAAMDGSE